MVVGGSGQVGVQLLRLLGQSGHTAVGTYYRNPLPGMVQLDASDGRQVNDFFARTAPALVINAVNAEGGPDACEVDLDLAERYHYGSGHNLAVSALEYGSLFVQISTDYVFDGEGGPYSETDATRPLSRLAQAKLRVEEFTLKHLPMALIVRSSFVFSWAPRTKTMNFVMRILDNHRNGLSMKVPVDQIGNVTYAPNLAEALLELHELGLTGVYHVAGTTRCSKFDWAMRVVEFFGLDPTLIDGVTTTELRQTAPRPLESGFVLDKARDALRRTRLMSLDESLADMKREMELTGARV